MPVTLIGWAANCARLFLSPVDPHGLLSFGAGRHALMMRRHAGVTLLRDAR
jgi:hypothetical protein